MISEQIVVVRGSVVFVALPAFAFQVTLR